MDTRLLELFLRVAEFGSINKAAADLHISQPTLSRQISALEKEMGASLFARTQLGVQLTETGKLLSDRARPILRQMTILKEQVGEHAAGQLALGTPPAWQHLFTSAFIEKLAGRYPDVSLRIYEGVSNVLRDYMFSGLLDIGIVPFDASPAMGYTQRPLLREPLVLVGRAEDGLSASTPVALSSLDKRKLVLPGRPNVLRLQVERALERKGLKFKLAVETDTLALCLDLARRGIGLTVVPACSLVDHGLGESISWSPIKGQFVTWVLCENEARGHSQAVREGHGLVLETLSEALGSGQWHGVESVPGGAGFDRRI